MFVSGKVALITGGAFGLGLEFARELLRNGVKGISLVDIDGSKGKDAVEGLSKEFGEEKVIFTVVDVTHKKELEDAMKKTVQIFGAFDILINNAGIMNDTVWEREIDINIKGLINGCILGFEEYLPRYNSGSQPVIVNIASTAAFISLYFLPVYTGTKHAVIGIGKTLALKENYGSQNVKILTLCPGPTTTTLIDNLEQRAFTPRLVDEVKTFFETYTGEIKQSPEIVAKALVKVLENGENGSVWIANGGELYEIEIPKLEDHKILRRL